MAELQTVYLGMPLANPVLVSSSSITGNLDGVKACAAHGAGAIVLKSMFEEIIVSQATSLDKSLLETEHPEAFDYVQAELGMQIGPKPYLRFIEDCRKAVTIPIIASINCVSAKRWISYAQDMESAGAQAIELNISHFPGSGSDDDVSARYADIVGTVTSHIRIPVAVKIDAHFTSLGHIIGKIVDAGASGLVLFNRTYTVDVDLATRRFVPGMSISNPAEMATTLRWIGIASSRFDCELSATTGIHDADAAIKMIMAGATTVQVCSTLYKNGMGRLDAIVKGIGEWLDRAGVPTVAAIRGAATMNTPDTAILLQRVQYLRALNEAASYEA